MGKPGLKFYLAGTYNKHVGEPGLIFDLAGIDNKYVDEPELKLIRQVLTTNMWVNLD